MRPRWGMTLFAVGGFFLINEITRRLPLWRSLSGPWRTVAWQVAQVVLCVVAVALVHRLRPGAAFREVGLGRSPLRAAGFSLVATLPMLVTYARAAGFTPTKLDWGFAIMVAMMAPLAEEVLFRGFLFGQLRRRARWSFWGAALVGLVPFALGHLYQAGHDLWGVVGVLAITGAGHLFFAWLLERWGDLWVPIGMHALMNLWWHLFAVDSTALGGLQANLARFLTVGLAIGLTLRLRRGQPTWAQTEHGPVVDAQGPSALRDSRTP
ncbi:CPBP family intramembrane glutamic endopeptidase [Pyxidicoccus trucidator]|uniref:CPBP family intramembrane glutamic endopeptidase n=1 Tax=Pyxidicoccus trucidator TaxID=2709662 RepID=UPI0013DBCFF7|nr:CPBP family intramembrane glutamic endopeptidase [Pyxidicoccus trucidator]